MTYFGLVLSLAAYQCGVWIRRRTGLAFLNPLLTAMVLVIAVLLGTGISYDTYNGSAQYLSFFLTPATVCLAIPLYKQLHLLKKHPGTVLVSIASGTITSFLSVLALCKLFGLTHIHYVTLLPKSITTAIGMGVSQEAGGIVTITVMSIVLTGIFGGIIAEPLFRLFGIRHPMAKGLALGTSAHAMGTSKALELGEIEGAMSSLSIAVAGLMTVILVPLVSNLM